jgi:hypothetical protein
LNNVATKLILFGHIDVSRLHIHDFHAKSGVGFIEELFNVDQIEFVHVLSITFHAEPECLSPQLFNRSLTLAAWTHFFQLIEIELESTINDNVVSGENNLESLFVPVDI